jgi:hypothetical protein
MKRMGSGAKALQRQKADGTPALQIQRQHQRRQSKKVGGRS